MTPAAVGKGAARVGLAVLVLIFVGLRVFDLTADPPAKLDWSGGIFFDEGMLAQGARNKLLFGNFFQDDWNDLYISPLLSLVKLAVLSVTGVGLLQVRVIPVALGLGSLLLFYLILRRGAGRRTALLGVTLLGCSHVYGMFNRIGLTETPVSFFMLLAGWLWQEGVLRSREPGGLKSAGAPRHVGRFFFGAGAVAFVAYTVKAFPYFIPALALAGILARRLPAGEARPQHTGSLRAFGAAAGCFLAGVALPAAVWYLAFYLRFAPSIDQANAYYRAQQIPRSASALIKDLVGVPFFGYFTVTPSLLVFSLLALGLGVVLWFHRRERLLPLDLFFGSWFVAHFVMFAVLQYRPVRYYLPIVPPMVALATRAMMLLGRRTRVRFPERLSVPSLALLFPWLAVCIFYGLPVLRGIAASWLGRRPEPLPPAPLAVAAAGAALALLAFAALATPRLRGRTFAIPPRAAAAVCIALPVVVSLAFDAWHWGSWATARRHVIRDTSRELGALPAGTFVAGLGATTLCLENQHRAIHVYEGFFNATDTFARFPITHLFMGGFNREVEFWYRRYPAEMKNAQVVRVIPVKQNHFYLYSLNDPSVEGFSAVDRLAATGTGRTFATIAVRNNDRSRARDLGGAVLLVPAGGGDNVVIPAAPASAVAPGAQAALGVPGPLPPGTWKLLAFEPPALEHVFAAEDLAHRTGRRIRDPLASTGEAWESGAPGTALFGPYLRYRPGIVRPSFRLRLAAPASGPAATLRVTTDRGRAVLSERRVDTADLDASGAYGEIVLPQVALDTEQTLEFTAEALGNARIVFDRVHVSYTPGVWWHEPLTVARSAPPTPGATPAPRKHSSR